MPYVNPIWLEGRRRYWQRHDWQRFIRHDAHRFLTPAAIAEEKRATEAEKAARHDAEAAAAAEHEAFYAEHLELRRQLADVKFELAFRRIFHKYRPDQPRDDRGRWVDDPDKGRADDAGKEGEDKPSDATDVSAARRSGRPRMPLEVRRDEVRERAERAIARVRELDPDWKPRTTSLTEPASIEGAIRHNEALTREAEARFVQLSRAGLDTNWPRRDPSPFGEILTPGGQLFGIRRPGTDEDARTATPREFEQLRGELMIGARQVRDDPRYNGVRYERHDGSVFGLRLSHDHGLTLDVLKSNTPSIKNGLRIHQR